MSKPYNYFDTPDGEDVLKKLWCVSKVTVPVSVAIATSDIMLYSHPEGYLATLGRYAYICGPLLGMSTAFVITTNLAANFRKKDDKLNWFLGALPAGGIYGAWRKSAVAGISACFILGMIAMFKKHTVQEGWNLSPQKHYQAHGGLRAHKFDFSLVHDRPGNWTTGEK